MEWRGGGSSIGFASGFWSKGCWIPVRLPNWHSVFWKDTLRIFLFDINQFIRCGGPARQKTCKQNPQKGGLDWWG